MTETQNDSIDIARLQRVALGLESQPFLNNPGAIEDHNSLDFDDLVALPQTDGPLTIRAPETAPEKSPPVVHEALASEEEDHNATGSIDVNRPSPEPTVQPPATEAPAAKMGSAETIPSDTQVISQSVYDEIIRKNKEAGNDGLDSVFDRNTLMTLQEGESGHLDLLSGFDGANTQAPNTDENDDQSSSKLGESSPLTYEHNHFPESQRFLAKTPATAMKQHDDGISTVSPLVSRNPLASDLETGSGIMALSQVFKATQAPSSPLVNGLQSDLLSDRPSPNIPIQHRPLAPSLSSPFNTMAATFPRDSSDTQLNYVTMKESQAKRNDMARERMTRSEDHIYSDDQSDGEFDKEPSFLDRMKRQRRDEDEANEQFALLSAPARQSSETGNRINSSPRAERPGSANGPTTGVRQDHRSVSELQAVGTSEEETEQEEELPKPTPRSQVPNSSTEEDKENCNDPTVVLSHTESAHGRLSQALSLHESPLALQKEPFRSSAGRDQNDGPAENIRSSPMSVVKDSQWSPGHDAEQAEQGIVESPSNRGLNRVNGSQSQFAPTAGDGNGGLSPAKQAPSQPPTQTSQTAPLTLPSTQSDVVESAKSSAQSREGSAPPQANMVRFSNSMAPNIPGSGDKTYDYRGKSSSMPSRVAETPVHRRHSSSNEVLPMGTIPETSPNHMTNDDWMSDANHEAAEQEDDDLPTPYPGALKRTNHSQPVISSSSPLKPSLNSKILSSPSGRQRRALTEIAADVSPQVGGSAFDINMTIMSADDHEFRKAVAMSPIPPHKKRRGNDGRHIPASDPVIPVTPRPMAHLTPLRDLIEEGPANVQPEQSPEPSPEPSNRGQRLFAGRVKRSRRSGSIWDTEDSPKFRVSSKERSKIFARSQARQVQRSPVPETEPKEAGPQETEPKEAPQPASVPFQAPVPVSPAPVPEAPSSAPPVEETSTRADEQPSADAVVVAPNQVLAIWKGRQRAYFPAVCFGKPFGNSQDQYLVKFEDSSPVEVQKGTVKRLELRIGDEVKIDMPNVPKVPHIVRGFTDKLSADELTNGAITDVYGHATLKVGLKQRKSLPSAGLPGPDNVFNVPVSRIYLDMILWNRFKDRLFTYTGSGSSDGRLQTPSDRHITPTSPSTRLSRSFRQPGLFSGMVFAVSFGDKSESKYRVTKLILENDGRILEDGFNELFDLPSNAPITTPTKSSAPQSTETNNHLRLKSRAEEIGFACLIADKHSRRPKYMQALALNLPCLSDRWIEDCVAKGQVLDWEMYLLPAGESSYLNGATKSRILAPYLATRVRLSETVAGRPNLLNGQSVLLVTGRSGKADEERRKAYIFLTYALGASRIERVPDIQSARAALNNNSQSRPGEGTSTWDWVYIDDDDNAAKAMAGNAGSASQSSKRRRKSRLTESFNGDDLGMNSNVRIVGNEFVCQSLILGKLVCQ